MPNWVKNLVLLVVTTAVAVVVAEVAARQAFPDWAPRTGRLADLWDFDPDYGWAYVPGSSGPFRSHSFDTHVAINQQGFRGPDIGPRSPSRPRVVVMGDSYVFGYGVEQDEMFTSRMGAMCPSLDVVNLGVSGYGTDQELLLLKNEGLSYEPDIVVLVMVDNDYENNLRPRVYVYYQKPLYVMRNDELVLTNHPVRAPNVLVRWAGRVARHSYLLNQINRALIGWRSRGKQRAAQDQAGSAGTGADRAPRAFPTSPAETITADIVSEFLGTAEAAGVKSMIVFVEGQSGRGRGMADYFAQRDVAFVQLDEVMPPGTYDQYRLQGDPHWNPAGHQLVARTVLDRLLASGWLSADACAAHDASDALNTPAPTRSP